MKWPLVRRRELEEVEEALRESEETAFLAVRGEANAIKRADRAEEALWRAFGLSAEDLSGREGAILEYRIHIHKRVLLDYHGHPVGLIADKLHRALDEMIQRGLRGEQMPPR